LHQLKRPLFTSGPFRPFPGSRSANEFTESGSVVTDFPFFTQERLW
jgi:hypothetical protein